MIKNLVIVFILISFAVPADAQSIILVRENVVIHLDSVHIRVNGEYLFRNTTGHEISQTMFFPLPSIKGNQKLDTLSITNASTNTPIRSFRRMAAGIFYQLSFQAQEQKKLRLYYSHDHDGKEAKYLLMTHVKYWNKPVSLEEFSVIFDEQEITIDSLSYKPDKTIVDKGKTTHSWHKVNFMPDKELDIWFHKD
jgi:hypothetical protein